MFLGRRHSFPRADVHPTPWIVHDYEVVPLNRKNALFAGHNVGGVVWGRIGSLIETAKMNRVEPILLQRCTHAGIVKLIECRLFSAFLHEAKLLNLRGGAIDNVPRFRSESG